MQSAIDPSISSSHRLVLYSLRFGLAFVWLATGLAVFHPTYRALGEASLKPLGLPSWVMFATCAGEVLLGLRVLFGRMNAWMAVFQAALILGFTALLTATQPILWLHPLGVLTKNLPLLAIIVLLHRLDRFGWDARGERLLRFGMAVVWLTDGVAAQFLYGPPTPECAPLLALIPGDPAATLRILGVLSAASGVAALTLRGWPRRAVLLGQIVVLAFRPAVISVVAPLLWVHPFGPLTKNVPLLIGMWIAFRGVSAARPAKEIVPHDVV